MGGVRPCFDGVAPGKEVAKTDAKVAEEKIEPNEKVKALISERVEGTTLSMNTFITPYQGDNIIADLKDISKNCPGLTVIDVACTKVTNVGLQEAAPHLKNITSINLIETNVSDAGLKEAAPHLQNLTFIGLQATNMSDAGLKEAAPFLKNLQEIILETTEVSGTGLKEAAPFLKNLLEI